jgi:hypothetical protein
MNNANGCHFGLASIIRKSQNYASSGKFSHQLWLEKMNFWSNQIEANWVKSERTEN